MEEDLVNKDGYKSGKGKEITGSKSEVLGDVKENGNHSLTQPSTEESHKSENILFVNIEEGKGDNTDMLSVDSNEMQNKPVSLIKEDCL